MPDNDQDQDNKPLHGPNLILDVENFGPIAEAKNIEFRPMTVFVGPSNTGKSYLAMLLHAILKATAQEREELNFWRLGVPFGRLNEINAQVLGAEIANTVREKIGTIQETLNDDLIELQVRSLTWRGQREFERLTAHIIDHVLDLIRRSVSEYFEVDDDAKLTNINMAASARSYVELKLVNEKSLTVQNSSSETSDSRYGISNIKLTDYSNPVSVVWAQGYFDGDIETEMLKDILPRGYLYGIMDEALPKLTSHFLPASRTGIMVSHATLTDRIIASASRISIEGPKLTPFHRIHAEFLRAINAVRHSIPSDRKSEREAHTLAHELETKVLKGSINVADGSIGLPRFSYGRDDTEIPLFRSSSMVTELAPLVLFLRNYVSVGDLLIVEEPESHLHPLAQQRLAGLLTMMVRSGFRILLTTHSDYFVEQLGIFRNASFLDSETRAGILSCFGAELDADLFLGQGEIAVYGFNELAGGAGTTVSEVPFDEISGSTVLRTIPMP